MHMQYSARPASLPGSPAETRSRCACRRTGLLARAALGLLACATSAAWAQPVSLGTATDFGVIAASAIANTGPSVITGDLGISPNGASSVTGFTFSGPPGPGQVIGTTHFANAVALAAQNDVTTAYNELAALPCATVISADLGGTTLAPGVYCSGSSMGLTGTVTLDAQGDPDAVFVFQAGSTLTTASNAEVSVINGGQSCNVFWQIGSSATLGTGTAFIGSILALESITLTTGSVADGRVLARTGAVTLDSSTVSVCALLVVGDGPTLDKAFTPATIDEGGVSTLTITLGNPDPTDVTLTAPLVDTLPAGVLIADAPNVATTCGGTGAPEAVPGGSTVTLPVGRIIPANGSCTLTVDVTAAATGSYVNTLPAGALVTSNGSNMAPAIATLTVLILLGASIPIPTLSQWAAILLGSLLLVLGTRTMRRRPR